MFRVKGLEFRVQDLGYRLGFGKQGSGLGLRVTNLDELPHVLPHQVGVQAVGALLQYLKRGSTGKELKLRGWG